MNPFCPPMSCGYGGLHPLLAAQLLSGEKKMNKTSSEAIGAYWLSSMLMNNGNCPPGYPSYSSNCPYPLLDINKCKTILTKMTNDDYKAAAKRYSAYKTSCNIGDDVMPDVPADTKPDQERLIQHFVSWKECVGKRTTMWPLASMSGCYPNPLLLSSLFT